MQTIDLKSAQALDQTSLSFLPNHQLVVTTSVNGGGLEIELDAAKQEALLSDRFLTADLYHESPDVLVIILTFIEPAGRHLSIHFGLLPHVHTRLCLPLQCLNGEKLFLDRYPGVLQTVLRGDSSISRDKITNITMETIPSTEKRQFQLTNLHFREEEPAFPVPDKPYIDALGQLLHKEWEGKMSSIDELKVSLQQESKALSINSDTEFSSCGGWKQLSFKASGFFRTEFDGSNWWFVDPEGYALFSLGIDCINPNSSMKVNGMESLISWLPDQTGRYADAWGQGGFDYHIANLIRVFDHDWRQEWEKLTASRLRKWKVNTIGNWSDSAFIQSSGLPYVYPLEHFPSTTQLIYRDFPDVFSPEYEKNAEAFSQQLLPLRDDPLLIGYFLRNEPHWAFVSDVNLTEIMLKQADISDSKRKFITFVQEKYQTIDRLNKAWGVHFQTFDDLSKAVPDQIIDSVKHLEDFTLFNQILIRRYVEIPSSYCRQADPNHLNLGMRYAWIANDNLLAGCEAFDVFSINCYQTCPDREEIEHLSSQLQMPVMIGEFHFGAADAGLLAYGIKATATQKERGHAYRYYVEQAATIPSLIGVHYFQYNDQPVLGRFDGENYQIGIVDVCQQPYQAFVEQMKIAHDNIYQIRTGGMLPLNEPPRLIPKTGF